MLGLGCAPCCKFKHKGRVLKAKRRKTFLMSYRAETVIPTFGPGIYVLGRQDAVHDETPEVKILRHFKSPVVMAHCIWFACNLSLALAHHLRGFGSARFVHDLRRA